MFNEILPDILNKAISFDIETTGLNKQKHNIYSMAYAHMGAQMPYEKFFYKKIPGEVNMGLPENASQFSLDIWMNKLSAEYINKRQSNIVDYLRLFNKELESRPFIVGHNLNFDFSFIMAQALKQDADKDLIEQVAKIQEKLNPLGVNMLMENIPEGYEELKNKIISNVGGVSYDLSEGNYLGAAKKIKQRIVDVLKTQGEEGYSRAMVLDTFTLSKIYSGLLQKPSSITYGGYTLNINNRAMVGLKLEPLASALGIKTSTIAHTGQDVIYNQPVFKTLMSDMDTLIEASKNNVSFDISSLSREGRSFAIYMHALSAVDNELPRFSDIETNEIQSTLEQYSKDLQGMKDLDLVSGVGTFREKALRLGLEEQINMMIKSGIENYNPEKGLVFKFRDTGLEIKGGDILNIDKVVQEIREALGESHFTSEEIARLYESKLGSLQIPLAVAGDEEMMASISKRLEQRSREISRSMESFYSVLSEGAARIAKVGERSPFLEDTAKMAGKSFLEGSKKLGLITVGAIGAATLFSLFSGHTSPYPNIDNKDKYAYPSIDNSSFYVEGNPLNYSPDYNFIGRIINRKPQQPFAGIGLEMSKHLTNHYFM